MERLHRPRALLQEPVVLALRQVALHRLQLQVERLPEAPRRRRALLPGERRRAEERALLRRPSPERRPPHPRRRRARAARHLPLWTAVELRLRAAVVPLGGMRRDPR